MPRRTPPVTISWWPSRMRCRSCSAWFANLWCSRHWSRVGSANTSVQPRSSNDDSRHGYPGRYARQRLAQSRHALVNFRILPATRASVMDWVAPSSGIRDHNHAGQAGRPEPGPSTESPSYHALATHHPPSVPRRARGPGAGRRAHGHSHFVGLSDAIYRFRRGASAPKA